MKKPAYRKNESQIINNFYTLVTIVIMAVVITIYTKYVNPNKEKEFTPLLLPCQSALQIEQRVSNPKLIKEANRLLEEGNYMINAGFILSENSPIEKQLSLETVNGFFENTIDVVAIANAQKFLNIKYELIENEKKANELSLLVSFRINANEVFRMIASVQSNQFNEIPQKVECIMNSFKQNAKQ